MLELMINGFEFTAVQSTEISLLDIPQDFPADATICTKKPRDHQLVPGLIERDPLQWFISMVRDPRDIISSRHKLHPEVYWANLRQWREWLDNTRPYRPHARLIEVRYEQLVRAPDDVQAMLIRRLPFLRPARPFSEFHRHATPSEQSLTAMHELRPVNDASVRRWKEHLPRVAGQISIHGSMADELIELGYEPDDRWLEALHDVQPDTEPSHWPEVIPEAFATKDRARQRAKLEAYIKARGLSE
ncbi:MAG: hypothetical protein R3212_06800 [Xanthomonadales bacterium]|nr:hypothetical protein [Xanthomonadales bacterium]